MRAKLHQMQASSDEAIGLIVVDYLQLMHGDRTKPKVIEVSELSEGLKQMARDFDCPVVALSQLSRAVEQRQDKRPMLSDLRDSGSIEQDADVVMFLYRQWYYDKMADERLTELIIAKQRDGEVGTLNFDFNGAHSRFTEWTGFRGY